MSHGDPKIEDEGGDSISKESKEKEKTLAEQKEYHESLRLVILFVYLLWNLMFHIAFRYFDDSWLNFYKTDFGAT